MQRAPCSVTVSDGANGQPHAGTEWAFPTLGGLGALPASLAWAAVLEPV